MSLGDVRAVYMPYCLKKQDDGAYAILNREYKPVGFNTRDFVKYEDYPVTAKLKGIGPATARRLSCHDKADTDVIYLYDDATAPVNSSANMDAYLEKLRILAKFKVEE